MDLSVITVFDASGSFIEMAKLRVNRNILRTLMQLPQLYSRDDLLSRVRFEYFSLGSQLQQLTPDPAAGAPALKTAGSANLAALSEYLAQRDSAACQSLPVLFCTDGSFRHDELKSFRDMLVNASHIVPLVVAVGIDADLDSLKTLTPFIFEPENILEAVDYAVSFCCGISGCPSSLDEIKVISSDDVLSADPGDSFSSEPAESYVSLLERYQMRMM